MTAVAISAYGPTGELERQDCPVNAHLYHASKVDTATITMSLVDVTGSTLAALTLGAWQPGYSGIIRDTTGAQTHYDVILTEHPVWVPGRMTATVTADSATGGDDVTASWTFDVITVIGGALQRICDLLEGRAGTTRTVAAGRLRHVDFLSVAASRVAITGPERAFFVTYQGLTRDPQLISSNYVHSDHAARVTVLHPDLPNQQLELERRMQEDSFLLRRTLEWPANWSGGWLGCTVTGITPEEVELEDATRLVALHFDMELAVRERQTTS